MTPTALSSTDKIYFSIGRLARDLKANLEYPFWVLGGRQAPDNHFHKKQRIRRLAANAQCKTFIETGTFYGQMVNFARDLFERVISIEIYPPFFQKNSAIFSTDSNVNILLGDSAQNLGRALAASTGRILFWLDGHYSGSGTGMGDKISPIIEELRIISLAGQCDHCIVIDDRRLFVGKDGYPTVDETLAELRQINPDYQITFDCDSIIASPKS